MIFPMHNTVRPSPPAKTVSPVSPRQIKAFFTKNGYYLAKKVFSPAQVKALETDFDGIVSQMVESKENIDARWGGAAMKRLGAEKTSVFHTHNVQNYSARWLSALQHPKFLDVASALLGPDVILHHTKLFQKPRGNGAPFPMHQDWEFFPTEQDTMIAGVVHVSEATDEMGCFRLYPGSHRLGRQRGLQGIEKVESPLSKEYPLSDTVPLAAKPGDVLFFHYLLLHGSKQNISDQVRKTVLVQMYSGRDRVETGNTHPNARLTLRGWNHAMTRDTAGLM